MIMPSDKDYKETKQIMLGKKVMKSEFKPLADWIDKTFSVKTINIYYDRIEKNRPRVEICFETGKEIALFKDQSGYNFDIEKQKTIANKFKEVVEKTEIKEYSFFNFFKKSITPKYQSQNLLVIYSEFESVAKTEANDSIPEEKIKMLKKELNNEDIWEISRGFSSTTFFLYTDEQVRKYENTDTSRKWTNKYFQLLSKYDKFGYFKRDYFTVFLDSKENFDKNYGSNWYYYYK